VEGPRARDDFPGAPDAGRHAPATDTTPNTVPPLGPDPTPEDLEAHLEAAPDGLDPSTLDEVDESSIPESVR
jgi:hypothetical protein